MSRDWSEQIGRCFSLSLSDDLAEWFDQELWREAIGSEFCQPVEPQRLLEPDRDLIWSGFMLPDTLPLVGDDRGDWICLRIAPDGEVQEAVQWYHGGGDWTPYGKNLADALSLDALRPDDLTRHSHPAEMFSKPDAVTSVRIQQWLATYGSGSSQPAGQIVQLRRLAIDALRHPLKTMCDQSTAEQVGIAWEPDLVRTLFDPVELAAPLKEWLTSKIQSPLEEVTQQDWDAAENAAKQATDLRDDLTWAWDISGWAAERRGDLAGAIACYLQGIQSTAFTDEAISLRSHWYAEGLGKFSAARLLALQTELSAEQRSDAYFQLYRACDAESLRSRVRDYWIVQANAALTSGQPDQAYWFFYRAGWDLGLQFISSYEEIFDGLIESADRAGWAALAKLARMYAKFLA